ncbi:MAG: hypothetical protein K0Q95_1334 [Bacteroidota bacterium]|jgi:hypothetical protein|nr:hypothetical protein [Bacteroidota bacterium]
MLYPKEAIQHLSNWVEGSTQSKNWLQAHNYEELVQLKDAASRHPAPFKYLIENKFVILAAFVNAVWDDKDAFKLLMDQKAFHWAAAANYINGDDKAAIFLKNNNLGHYAELAFKIQAKIRKEGDEGTNFFNSGPFKV